MEGDEMAYSELERETKIYWLNWKELLAETEYTEDSGLLDKTEEIARYIEGKCGEENFLEWTNEELLEERLWESAVLYHVGNAVWTWEEMVKDLLKISKKNPEIIFMVNFIEGKASEKTFLHAGRITTVLIDLDTNRLIECF